MKKYESPDFELLDNIMIGGLCKVRLDDDFTLLAANDRFYNFYGYTPQEMQIELGNRLISVIARRDVDNIRKVTLNAFQNGRSYFEFEKHITRRDGKEVLLRTKGLFVVENNEVVMYCNVMDMTEFKNMQQQLNLDEQKLKIALSQTSNIIYDYDLRNHTIHMDRHASELFALPQCLENIPESLIGGGIIHEDNAPAFRMMFERINQGEAMAACIARAKIFDGTFSWFRHTLNLIYDRDGNAIDAVGILEDITSQKEAEISYVKEEQYRQAMLSDALYWAQVDLTTDTIEKFVDDKKQFPEAGQYKKYSDFVREMANRRIHIEEREKYRETFKLESLKKAFEEGKKEINFENRRVDEMGNFIWYVSTAYLLRDPLNGELKGLICLKDINEKKRREMELRYASQMDMLTGIYNKKTTENYISDYLKSDAGRSGLHAFLIIDVDDFKNINDKYGHLHGDHVLREIAEQLKRSFRKKDIVGRIGGDEFVVFMRSIMDVHAAEESARKVCELFHDKYHENEDISCSIGVAYYPEDGTTYEELYKKSDIALYEAKNSGKNKSLVYRKREEEEEWFPPMISKIDQASEMAEDGELEISEDVFLIADAIEEPVYLSDPETYEIFFMNQYLCHQLDISRDEYKGKPCYEVLQGLDAPCPFCTNDRLSFDRIYSWERLNQRIGRSFMLKDKFVMYRGKKARLEYAVDITEKNAVGAELAHQLEAGNMLLECVRRMVGSRDLKETMNAMLETISSLYNTDRAYVFEYKNRRGILKSMQEVCKPGVESRMTRDMDENAFNSTFWMEHLDEKGIISVEDVEKLRLPYTDEYKNMWKYRVKSFYAVPIRHRGEAAGFLVLENPDAAYQNTSLLESIVYFTENVISNKILTEKFEYMSYHDGLTGLLNRNGYIRIIEGRKDIPVKSAGVLTININGLKELNESFGHKKGDEAVRDHASTFRKFFSEDQVFRLSGDEFVVIWVNSTEEVFRLRAREMEAAIDELDYYGASVGVVWSGQEPDIPELIRKADELMLAAKQRYYDNKHHKSRHIETKNLQALLKELKDGHFMLYLQPKVDIKTGKVVSAEALSRYYTEKTGLITPGRFIPILETERIIRYLDLFIVEEVCRLLRRWIDEGIQVCPVSLNISRITLLEEKLADTLHMILSKYDIPTSLVDVEVTETVGQMDQNTLIGVGRELKQSGFHVHLDDFGARYSNTMLLALFQFDVLKLDKSLVNDLVNNEKNQIIVRHIFDMCRELGLSVVAEGVEELEQRNLLEELGCRYIQGFLYGKPVPVEDFRERYLNK